MLNFLEVYTNTFTGGSTVLRTRTQIWWPKLQEYHELICIDVVFDLCNADVTRVYSSANILRFLVYICVGNGNVLWRIRTCGVGLHSLSCDRNLQIDIGVVRSKVKKICKLMFRRYYRWLAVVQTALDAPTHEIGMPSYSLCKIWDWFPCVGVRASAQTFRSSPRYLKNYFQDNPPYNKGAFKIEINFPAEYPFKPPKISFKTKIYHPNIDEKGQVCLPIISAENWKPATKTDQGNACVGLPVVTT